ncbi:MAG: hypothetical protein ACXVPQ_07395 [Bacteroidia bacterium]
MKFKKTYLAFLLLGSFLTSIGVNTYIGNLASIKKSITICSKDTQISAADASGAAQDNLVFEENEDEQEKDGTDAQFFYIQFLFSFLSHEVNQTQFFSAEPLAEHLHNPIYIAVRSFRI